MMTDNEFRTFWGSQGRTQKESTFATGLSVKTVMKWLRRLGLPLRSEIWKARRVRIQELWTVGYTSGQIGRLLGISGSSVRWHASKMHLPGRPDGNPFQRSQKPPQLQDMS